MFILYYPLQLAVYKTLYYWNQRNHCKRRKVLGVRTVCTLRIRKQVVMMPVLFKELTERILIESQAVAGVQMKEDFASHLEGNF